MTTPATAYELGRFLRSRREHTRPEDVGLVPGGRRKVDGLRREEVAALAGLSVDYYQRLEQGRNVRPSDTVLDSIADALELDETERGHLSELARAARRPVPVVRRAADKVPANASALLAATSLPAIIVSRFLDLLDWNDPAAELLGDPRQVTPPERNVLFAVFRDEAGCLPQADGEAAARDYLGMLRAAVSQDPSHPRAAAIVGALSVRSAAFRRLWARNEVRDRVHGTHVIGHPRVGDIAMEWDSYPLGRTPGAMMIVFTPKPDSVDRLRMLATTTARDLSARM